MTRDEAIEAGARVLWDRSPAGSLVAWKHAAPTLRAHMSDVAEVVLDAIGWRDEQTIKAEALREFAQEIRQVYPEDVFIPPTQARLHAVHEWLKAQGGTLDAISAHVMRNAARIAETDADSLDRGDA